MGDLLLGSFLVQSNKIAWLMNCAGILREQFTSLPDHQADLNGKTVIVVGANVSLGFEGEGVNRDS